MGNQHNSNRTFRLASIDGRRVDSLPALDVPEAILVVSFEGLTEDEQRRALAGFPGGKRFRLAFEAPNAATSRGGVPRDSRRWP